ncbi:MAG TPA: response regulator transcription factor [Tissierellaceae bacterium]
MDLIYCVEDDKDINDLINYALNSSGFKAEGFKDSKEFNLAMDRRLPDLILLDIMLPGEDGISIMNNLKNSHRTKDIPIIFVTAKTSEYDKIKGLDMGADDYIVKPFSVMELISRVKAVLRRVKNVDDKVLKFENIYMDYSKRVVFVDEDIIDLTYKEFELLYFLLQNQNIVVTRDQIIEIVWGFDYAGETRTIDVHIGTLRKKLKSAGDYIQTIRNVGYKIGEIV